MSRILIMSFSDLARDPRVNRQVRLLGERYEVTCAGLGRPTVSGVEFVPIRSKPRSLPSKVRAASQLLGGNFESFYWQTHWVEDAKSKLGAERFDAILANDLETLPLATAIAAGASVVYDAHEYSPRQFEDRFLFRLMFQRYKTYLCRKYMPRAKSLMTVSGGIAEQYVKDFGVPRPEVVMSLPDFEEFSPQPVNQNIRLVHHGAATRSRRLERMVELMRLVDERFELYLVLIETSPGYISELKRMANGDARIHFLEPVAMPEIPRFLNQFDVGLAYFEPSTFNLKHVLPNKFFEFIQARLALAIGPSPEMGKIVEEHELGVISEEFSPESLAKALNGLSSEDIQRYKANANAVARMYSAETTRSQLLAIVEEALDSR